MGLKMPSSKSKCSKCLGRHVPPTGKKCKYLLADDMDEVQGHSSTPVPPVKRQSSKKASDVQTKILEQLERANSRLDHMEDEVAQCFQDFARNILDEKSQKTREIMLTYLADLMKDSTDFSWQGAKVSHAVLLCEMERGGRNLE